MKTAVRNTISATDLTIRESRTSRTGKYVSLSVNTTVASDEERVGYCERLQSHPAIRYVL
jgi:putative lipoic acid-binding regulatory protein